MEFTQRENIYLFLCIVSIYNALALKGETEQHAFAEMKKYFGKELERFEQQHEFRVNMLQQEIDDLKKQVVNERNERSEQIRVLTNKFDAERQQMTHKIEILKEESGSCKDILELTMKQLRHTADAEDIEELQHTLPGDEIRRKGKPDSKLNYGNEDRLSGDNKTNITRKPHTGMQRLVTGNKRQVTTGSGVAFFSRLTNGTPKLQPNQDIIFDDVVINLGGGYHSTHGTFIAPVPGIYVFTTSMLSNGKVSHAKLVKNGQLLARLDCSEADGIAQAGQTVIVQLAAGEDVAVQVFDYPDTVFYGNWYSTFSGFLLYTVDGPEITGK